MERFYPGANSAKIAYKECYLEEKQFLENCK
jgi:hypothetical protein